MESVPIRTLSLFGSSLAKRKLITLSEKETANTAKHLSSSLWFLTVIGLPKSAGMHAWKCEDYRKSNDCKVQARLLKANFRINQHKYLTVTILKTCIQIWLQSGWSNSV